MTYPDKLLTPLSDGIINSKLKSPKFIYLIYSVDEFWNYNGCVDSNTRVYRFKNTGDKKLIYQRFSILYNKTLADFEHTSLQGVRGAYDTDASFKDFLMGKLPPIEIHSLTAMKRVTIRFGV